jgi:structural maintenance of chromosome 4
LSHTAPLPPCRLEGLNEKRQTMVQRVKAAQKERDNLQGDKDAAEEYLAKERECMGAQSELAQVLAAKAKVREGWLAGGGVVKTA